MRALLIVLDSAGVGHAPDAAAYGDDGANTLRHVFDHEPWLTLPTLEELGLDHILSGAGNGTPSPPTREPAAAWGWMREKSAGKDTTTGHWEIAGAVTAEPFAVFKEFPPEIVAPIEKESGVSFIGNYPESGTVIIDKLGSEHLASGNPILYTSADSVLQIAAHEDVVPVPKLYEICRAARRVCDAHRIGRVIARPFSGDPGNFRRTANRRDFSMRPPRTILNQLQDRGVDVFSVGKIHDIFAGSGIRVSHHTESNADGMHMIETLWSVPLKSDSLVFANLVDFDSLYGHRRNPAGYAEALREFDQWLAAFLPRLAPDDLLILTADHGNDPTWHGTDHTREMVPLVVRLGDFNRPLGRRETFSDIAASLAVFFKTDAWPVGESFLPEISK